MFHLCVTFLLGFWRVFAWLGCLFFLFFFYWFRWITFYCNRNKTNHIKTSFAAFYQLIEVHRRPMIVENGVLGLINCRWPGNQYSSIYCKKLSPVYLVEFKKQKHSANTNTYENKKHLLITDFRNFPTDDNELDTQTRNTWTCRPGVFCVRRRVTVQNKKRSSSF